MGQVFLIAGWFGLIFSLTEVMSCYSVVLESQLINKNELINKSSLTITVSGRLAYHSVSQPEESSCKSKCIPLKWHTSTVEAPRTQKLFLYHSQKN